MLRELAESASNAVLRRIGRAYGRVQESTPLQADLLESDEALVVVFDAPGAQSSDVQVKVVDDRVLVRIDRFRAYYEDHEMRFPGRGLALDGEVTLPEDVPVDPTAGSATLTEHGTLEIRVPKQDTETDTSDEEESETSTTKEVAGESQSDAEANDFDAEIEAKAEAEDGDGDGGGADDEDAADDDPEE
jgi:HSP20 family molecular chaperone IbpA